MRTGLTHSQPRAHISGVPRLHALPALLFAALSACSSLPARAPSTTRPSVLRVYDSKSGTWSSFAAMTASLARADVVFFGEQHDDPDTHAAELAVLAALGERRAPVVLSLEMFERDVQPLLDRFLAGAASESLFIAGSRPWDRYTTDYRALVELARARGWPVVASNIPRRMASAISRGGLGVLDTMSAQDRAYAARDHSCSRDAYYTRFAETMTGHGAGNGPASAADSAVMRSMTDRFYEAQCAKDEAMAESIVRAYGAAGTGTLLLHVNGAFHSNFGLGTAARVTRRAPKLRTAVITGIPNTGADREPTREERESGDWLVFTRGKQGAK